MENSSSNTWIKIVGAIVVIIIIVFAIMQFTGSAEIVTNTPTPTPTTPTPTPPGTPVMPPATTPPGATKKYKDGTYTAVGSYTNPASREEVTIDLVIKDDKITSSKFTGSPDNPTTVTMQGKFSAGFQAVVVGKSVDEVNLTAVNGSSLAPRGFMDALNKIKTQAKA